MSKPANPREAMVQLDAADTPYWLENVRLTNGKTYPMLDVVSYGPDWLRVAAVTPGAAAEAIPKSFWLNFAHIISFELAEG